MVLTSVAFYGSNVKGSSIAAAANIEAATECHYYGLRCSYGGLQGADDDSNYGHQSVPVCFYVNRSSKTTSSLSSCEAQIERQHRRRPPTRSLVAQVFSITFSLNSKGCTMTKYLLKRMRKGSRVLNTNVFSSFFVHYILFKVRLSGCRGE